VNRRKKSIATRATGARSSSKPPLNPPSETVTADRNPVQELFQIGPFSPKREALIEEINSKGLLPEFLAEVERRASQASAISPEQRKALAYQAELEAARGSGDTHWLIAVLKKRFLQIESVDDRAQYFAEIGQKFDSVLAPEPWFIEQTEHLKRIAELREISIVARATYHVEEATKRCRADRRPRKASEYALA